ncbi:MAG: hypothetical protein DHS20C15_20320 [Planctomycetota bacterium]|nr:MAG: hypothetical protein DHS20C15_20320 [Planctomycetota bacterium]
MALHLFGAYWRFHNMEAFAAMCGLVRPMLQSEARAMLGQQASEERVRELVDGVLSCLFCAESGQRPWVLHLRAFARSWMRASCTQPAPEAPERLSYLAGVE